MIEPLEASQTLTDQKVTITDGNEKNLSEFVGPKGLVLYFYPKDNTPGCTTQACDFRDNLAALERLGYGIVGVSGDSVQSHQNFTQKQSLSFPLIADEKRKLSIALGVYGAKKLYGKIVQGLARTTFILDPKLKITKVYKNVKAKGHVARVVEDLQKTQP